MITIYQIQISNEMADRFNAGGNFPEIETWRKLLLSGSKNFTEDMLEYFTPVYEVDVDELEAAFEITNMWVDKQIVRVIPDTEGRSSSVGDIFEKEGKLYMVDSFGFGELNINKEQVAV